MGGRKWAGAGDNEAEGELALVGDGERWRGEGMASSGGWGGGVN